MKFLGLFSRITTAGRVFIPQIDGLRFIAILSVVAYHIRAICRFHFHLPQSNSEIEGDLVYDFFLIGDKGVMLFFAISGFILSLPFARQFLSGGKKVPLREYYIRRVTRIEPPYVIHLAFLFLLCAFVLRFQPAQALYDNHAWAGFAAQHILASLIYLNGFIFGTHPYPNVVLWTLEVEVQFYLLAPFLARVFTIRDAWKRRAILAGLILLLPVAVQSLIGAGGNSYRLGFSLAGCLQFFLVGFLLADLFLAGWLTPATRTSKWDGLFLLMPVVIVWCRHSPWLPFILPSLIFISCVAAFRGMAAFRFLGNPWITTIGGMCYTIYMYHWLMISALIRLTGRLQTHILWLDLLIQFVVMSVIIISVCAILFALFERPFMRRNWPSVFWSRLFPAKKTAATD
jgi:peptidoglycan/LPS O-acetylase OafA/YrhL